jgi:hypothetical protein|tara:strand:+ start:309 stop:533 length:225 start_codon:yes stop_codon:yes gene_type:complete
MWAAAPVLGGFQAPRYRLNLSRSYMSQYISTYLYIVQEWLLEMSGFCWAYSAWQGLDIKLESLILAQNERWRHA